MKEIFYRYEDVQYAPSLDEYDDPIPGSGVLRVHLRTYEVAKHTPCGVQLEMGFGATRFVNTQRRKQFAHATKDAAKEAFIARKTRQAAIHQVRVNRAEKAIRIIQGKEFDL